jgi:hypothetical protein
LTASTSEPSPRLIPSPPELVMVGFNRARCAR